MFETLSKEVPLDDLINREVSIKKLSSVNGVGFVRGNALLRGLEEKKSLSQNLFSRIKIKKDKEVMGEAIGLSFCITGTLSRPRKEIEQKIEANGGTVRSSVSSALDYLVAGENAGSKIEKAKKNLVKIISEEDLYNLLGEKNDF